MGEVTTTDITTPLLLIGLIFVAWRATLGAIRDDHIWLTALGMTVICVCTSVFIIGGILR